MAPSDGPDDRRQSLLIDAASADDTIFALSSGAPPAAIAIVRVSGPQAATALSTLAGTLPSPRTATLARLSDSAGVPLDQALLLWFPGPATVTGEDLAEFHLHGGRATIAAVLATLGTLPGLRGAEPGEFTRRALANGRLDLAQTEGLADLLRAETESQRRAALRIADGGLSNLVRAWSERLLILSATVEAAIEFAEDEDDVPDHLDEVVAALAAVADEMRHVLHAPPAERLRDGIRIVIAGPVNSGKSSLINELSGRDAAIATPVAGTTRDLIEVPIILAGVPIVLIDSAGLRTAGDEVERIGIGRARDAIAAADLVLWLGEADDAPERDGVIAVHARCDLPDRRTGSPDRIAISVVTGEGLHRLRYVIRTRCAEILPAGDGIALNGRHRAIIQRAVTALTGRADDEILVVAERLRGARQILGEVTGNGAVEEMLDALFSQFCIGK